MKIICIGNYPPRQCGIATFTKNLLDAINQADIRTKSILDVEVIAMNDSTAKYNYPPLVSKSLSDNDKDGYVEMADYINNSGADVCLLQHEYGIFGGDSGVLLLGLLRALRIPIVVTLHTVLEKPGFHQHEVMKKIASYATYVVVMSSLAVRFLEEIYEVPSSKIVRIEHGVPDFEALKPMLPPTPADWKNRKVMLTFGLIGRSKGIETAIRALPDVVKQHPELVYVVVGKTHPHVIKSEGESYRNYLKSLAAELKLENHIQFVDSYLSEEELMAWLLAADMYVTPYPNKAQITSGTLSYAVGGGCAVLSTPYWHAEELLSEGRGRLFDFGNSKSLALMLNQLLGDESQLAAMQKAAYDYGKTISWPIIGKSYLDLFEKACNKNAKAYKAELAGNLNKSIKKNKIVLPLFSTKHLERLTDSTGLLQHATGSIPNYKTGYCVDDNARALLLSLMAFEQMGDELYKELAIKYLSFLKYMQTSDGDFINFLTYDRSYYDQMNSEDAFGRAFWSLGYLIRFAPDDAMFQLAMQMYNCSLAHISSLRYARGLANVIFGVYHYTLRFPDQEKHLQLLINLANKLCEVYTRHRKPLWFWFEDAMTYDNGLLPAALYMAYERTGIERYREYADESRIFLESKCFKDGYLTPIGNKKWLGLDDSYEMFAQQPIDAMAMVLLYNALHKLDNAEGSTEKLQLSFLWFLGHNELDIPLFDRQTGGCNDGIESMNINRNQGAESTVAYLLSHLISKPYFA
jgi:glycosyltransferase involved in cell wall biosynthesis